MTTASFRVLVVDDNATVRQSLKSVVQSFPNTVIVGEAANGEEAVASVGTLQPNVVLMDINIPALDGIASTRQIKSKYPHIAVIGLSADAAGYLRHAMTMAGAFEVLPKENALALHDVMQKAVHAASHRSP